MPTDRSSGEYSKKDKGSRRQIGKGLCGSMLCSPFFMLFYFFKVRITFAV